MLKLVSKTSTAAIGRSPLRLSRLLKSLGRASARHRPATSSSRRASSSRCRSCNFRWLVRCRWSRKRNAGKNKCFGFCRMMRCSKIGTPIKVRPPSRTGKTKLMGTLPRGFAQKKVSGTFRRSKLQHLFGLESSRHLFLGKADPRHCRHIVVYTKGDGYEGKVVQMGGNHLCRSALPGSPCQRASDG